MLLTTIPGHQLRLPRWSPHPKTIGAPGGTVGLSTVMAFSQAERMRQSAHPAQAVAEAPTYTGPRAGL
jgi:hypothetical protein